MLQRLIATDDGAGFHLPPGGLSLDEVEMSLVRQAIAQSEGNQTRAAELLGISRDEQEPGLIDAAAIRQTTHVRTYQTGKYADEANTVLNEIAAAQICLTDPAQRAAYDAQGNTGTTSITVIVRN